MEERQDLQQAPVSPEIIREESSHRLKKSTPLDKRSLLSKTRALDNTVTTSQTNLETLKNSDKETLVEQETNRNMDTADGSVNCSMTFIAQKKVQEDAIQRGYNSTYTDLPTDNHLEILATIHAHHEKKMQGFSAYMETKEEMEGKMLQEIANETIHFSSAKPSSELSLEMKMPVPALLLSNIVSAVSSEGIFPSPVRSNRLFARAIRNFLDSLDAVYKEDQDIYELCEEISSLIKECNNITKEERDKIRGKIEEIYTIKKEMERNLASIKKNGLNSPLATALLEASASMNSPAPGSSHSAQLPSYNSLLQEEKESESIANTFSMQNVLAVSKKAMEARIRNHGTISQLNQLVGNNLFFLPPELAAKSAQMPLKKVILTAELTKTLQNIYQQNYAKLPRLFSEETEAIADTFVNVAILKEEEVRAKETKLDTVQEKKGGQANDKEIQDNRLQSHEHLYEVHETIAIGALFAPLLDTRSPRKLLLYGRAGIGKTVLCQYIVNQWAEKSDNVACFSQFQAVFWIQLRELLDRLEDRRKHGRLIQEEMLVAEMVTACCLRDSNWQEKAKKEQLHLWLKANAESTLFILDGYDEIAETAAVPCVLSDCLDAVLNETQYKPYVMLTSRPIAMNSRYSFDRRLECMGFSDKNIPVFVSRYISELQQSNDCLTFLKAHPSIWGTAHVPIHLELICWLWSRGELALRSEQCLTMTALYTEIVEKIGRANYNKHPLLKETCLYICYDKESLTKKTIVHFANDFLSFLGFHAMQQEGVLLPGKKIKAWAHGFIRKSKALQADETEFDAERLLKACLDLGLLKSTRQGAKYLFDHTYYFIHLSFQEFFAAKYYQQAFERSDTKVIEHFCVHKYTLSYQLTWWMSAGLLYQQGSYSSLRNFFETLCTPPLDLIGIHHANLLSHCLDECQADEKVEVVAQLTQHLAGFLQPISKQICLADTWGKTLLHCSNLLRAKSFQDAGLNLFKKQQQSGFILSNIPVLLSHLDTQEAIACLPNQAIFLSFREALAQGLVQCSDLTVEQVQSLLACVTDTRIHSRVRVGLAEALAQRSGLTAKQVQSLLAYVTDTKLNKWEGVVKALARRSDLTAEQVQSLLARVTDTKIHNRVHEGLVEALAQRSDLTAEQVQSLLACVTDTKLNRWEREGVAKALARRSGLTAEQVQFLLACVTDTMFNGEICEGLAEALAQRSDLTAKQVQSLFACITDTKLNERKCKGVAEALAWRSDLTVEQVQSLFACVTDTRFDSRVRVGVAEALAQRSDLTAEQVQSLIACITDTKLSRWECEGVAKALARRSGLTAEQVQSLLACVTGTMLDGGICKILAQCSSFNVQQLQQILFYFLKNKIIYEENLCLIISVLRTYYSTNQIEQHTVLSGLSTFLTRPSTWFSLAKQQALFLYDEANRIALLRLGTQTIEIPLHLNHNLFLMFSHKVWGGNLHSIKIEEVCRQKTEDYLPL